MAQLIGGRQQPRLGSVPSQIVLRRAGQYVRVTPPVEGLDRVFFTGAYVPVEEPDGTVDVVRVVEPLVFPHRDVVDGEGQLAFAGIEEPIKRYLEARGAKIELRGYRPKLPAINEQVFARFQTVDRRVLQFVGDNDRGVIRYGAGVRPAKLIAQMIFAWPKKTFLIATTRIDDARDLADDLTSMGVEAAHFTEERKRIHARVIVGTYCRFGTGAATLEFRNVFVAMNPTELFNGAENDYAISLIKRLHRARAVGMLAGTTPLPPRLNDYLFAFFGPRVLDIPRHGQKPRDVEVVFTPVVGGPNVPNRKHDYVVRQHGIVEHQVRNRRIVRLASAIVRGDRALIEESFPELRTSLSKLAHRRVCVLVDSVDHAEALAGKLACPAFTCIDGEIRKTAAPDTLNLIVATALSLKAAGNFDILIRADGGNGLPLLPTSLMQHDESEDLAPLLVIDFDDRHHPVLRQASRRRRAAYKAAGFIVDGRRPDPLADFLTTRLEAYAPRQEVQA
jgi:hypothetical protein